MKKTKRVAYQVQCAYDSEHLFEKVLEVEVGSENRETDIETYCPFCNKQVEFTIKGEPPRDQVILRKFNTD